MMSAKATQFNNEEEHLNDSDCSALQDVTHQMTLHQNLISSNWSKALTSLYQNPHSASIWIIHRHGKSLPLHSAILYGAPSHLTIEILRAYPDAARERDLQGRLPLHIAASVALAIGVADGGGGKRVITELVREYPEALWVADESGRVGMELVEMILMMMQNIEPAEELRCVEGVEKKEEGQRMQQQRQQIEENHQQKVQQVYPQQQQQKQKSERRSFKLGRKKNQQQSQKQEYNYNSLYNSLSHGGSNASLLPNNNSSSNSNNNNSTNQKIITQDDDSNSIQSSTVYEEPLAQISILPKVSKEDDFPSLVHCSNNQDDPSNYGCHPSMSYDDITYAVSGSMDKEEEEEEGEDGDTVAESGVKSVEGSISTIEVLLKVLSDPFDEKLKFVKKRSQSSINVHKVRSKRRKKESSTALGESKSFESIASSNSKERESDIKVTSNSKEVESSVPKQCDCYMCTTAVKITKDMEDMKRDLLAFDLVMPTLLMDYLVGSHWDNVMSRIRDAPSEVKAWARKEVGGDVVLDMLPLHAAIIVGAPSDVIIALLEAYPAGAGEIDCHQSFPIHLAASCLPRIGRGDRVVSRLLEAFRSGKQAVDANGRTPGEIVSIMSAYCEHTNDYTRRRDAKQGSVKHQSSFEEDAAFAHLVEKAMTNLDMPLTYHYSFLRQASAQGIETLEDLVTTDDEALDTLFSKKELTAELRRLLSIFIEG